MGIKSFTISGVTDQYEYGSLIGRIANIQFDSSSYSLIFKDEENNVLFSTDLSNVNEEVRNRVDGALESIGDLNELDTENRGSVVSAINELNRGILVASSAALMTNTGAIYRYVGSEDGYEAGSLYYHNGTDWESLGGGVQAGTLDDMTNTKMLYRYTGAAPAMVQNALYYHNGTDWVPVSANPYYGNAKNTVSVVPRWIVGAFNASNGIFIDSTTSASHRELIKVQKGATIQIKETEEDIVFNLALFNPSGTFIKTYKTTPDSDAVTIEMDCYIRVMVKYSNSTTLDAATAATIGGLIKITTPVYYGFNSIKCKTEYGSHNTTTGMPSITATYAFHRSQKIIKTSGSEFVRISIPSALANSATYIRLLCFGANKNFLQLYDNYSKEKDCVYVLPTNVEYIRIAIAFDGDFYDLYDIEVSAQNTPQEVYGFNRESYNTQGYVGFNFPLSENGRLMGNARLLLPPNYDPVNGKGVPLILLVPGSGGTEGWSFTIQKAYRPVMDYFSKEGFAVLFLYPWTNKIDVGTAWSPYKIPIINKSYIAGINYACSRYNIDIDRVCCFGISQAGAFLHWAIMQNDIPIKAAAFASTGQTILKYNWNDQFFLQQEARSAITKYVDFDGTETEITDFINTGRGLESPSVMAFIRKNYEKFVPLMPWAEGIVGLTAEEILELGITPETNVPQWMVDKGIPAQRTGGQPMSAFANRGNLSKHAFVPSLFFGALDDDAVSTESNYAIYTWLLNGGSDTRFRMFPNGQGGHTCAWAGGPTTNVTTALGIELTNVQVGLVEAVAFFHDKLCDL